ncbi:MAG: DUF6666 family protein [Thermoguttaceae bacterium]
MSLIKQWIANLMVIGMSLTAVCPIASAQSVFDDSESDATPQKAEWRQKVLHNNRAPQQVTSSSAQDSEPRTIKWSPYPNSSQDADNSTNVRRSPYANSNQDTEYRTAQRSSGANVKQDAEYNVDQRSPYQNSNRNRPSGVSPSGNVQPKNYRMAQREVPAMVEGDPGATQYEPLAAGGSFAPQDGCGSNCGDCGDCCQCGDCDCPWLAPCGGWGPRNLAIFAGVNGYKGPRDRGGNGNFGFTEGVNWGAPLGDPWGCGYQLGFAALQDNISGYQENAPTDTTNQSTIVTADRHQYFFTAGIFNRAECCGWQWGVAFDLLHDTYYEQSDLKQIRTETGYLFNECTELGYSGAYGVGGDSVQSALRLNPRQVTLVNAFLNPTDQFVVYCRRHFQNGGDGRLWGGLTGMGDGLFGADFWVPLGGSWALQNTFNYLIPKQGRGDSGGQINESWSLAINLVWYPGRSTRCLGTSCYRPVLNVADNSLFMVKENRQTQVVPSPAP